MPLATKEAESGRSRIVRYLIKELVGPKDGEYETIESDRPDMRYTLGVLFPRGTETGDLSEERDVEEDVEGAEPAPPKEERTDDPVALAAQLMPASLGLSFYFTGTDTLEVELWGATYEQTEDEAWHRKPIADEQHPETVTVSAPNSLSRISEKEVFGGRAHLHVTWRQLGEGYLVTVTLVNAKRKEEKRRMPNASDCLYQVGFRCRVRGGEIREYPSVDRVLVGEEERELDLLYRKHRTFGVGHGCAAKWDGDPPMHIATDLIPTAVVPAMTHELKGDTGESVQALQIAFLADESIETETLCATLTAFLDRYEEWIEELPKEHTDIPPRLHPARDRILERLRETLARMRGGVERLRSDAVALRAFRLANLAMLMQMHHGREDLAGAPKPWPRNQAELLPDNFNYLTLPYTWRPFQLAFQLLTLEGLANYDSPERDLADLIWFPTGGGKTEAYLAVAAFEIIRRRLVHREAGAGTAVITRYTLRLLTSQQFQRSSRLICALELLRRRNSVELGDSPITVGFWAGENTSPNSYRAAADLRRELIEAGGDNPFQLERCPWCGTELAPAHRVQDEGAYGFRADNASFEVFCPTERCPFHDVLPVSVVDEHLYDHPPTFLVGTVDKFARLAWVPGAGAFFGGNGILPPTLVIQDELHLLSGPLGTTAAVYEAALHELMRHDGRRPKVVASTATIRSASDQVKALFNREVRLFPPPGLDADDSFFARADREAAGRLYVGVLSPHHKPSTSLIRTAAGLLQAPEDVLLDMREDDIYRTLVVYHLSLRELGKTSAYAYDDIPAWLTVIAPQEKVRRIQGIVELTSNTPSYQIPKILENLARSPDDPNFVDVLVCTNMISVGVDVDRLALMIVHGQPKTTSEYIQASSRVGRKYPGLVVAHYAANKPRDRSHYEDFHAYHATLYRHVEPTSVTPFSAPSRERSLHAALVLLVRHGSCGLKHDEHASSFSKDNPCVRKAVDALLAIVREVDEDELPGAEEHLRRLVEEWDDLARTFGKTLKYAAYRAGRQFRTLLKLFGREGDGWPTLNSMRNVEGESPIRIDGAVYD